MTLIRRAAQSIVTLVIRLTSRDSRDWAQAMLGELSYIESDWAALRWALGSMQVLFVSQRGHTMTMSDIPAAAKSLARGMTLRTWVGGASVTSMALVFTWNFIQVPNPVQRVGFALLVAAMLFMLFQLVSGRPHKGSVEADLLTQAAHYGSELGREWNFHRGRSLWSRLFLIIPGFLLLGVGDILAHPATVSSNLIRMLLFLSLAALAIPNNQRHARRYAAQLEELEQLQHKG
jgi:hypothetical protein